MSDYISFDDGAAVRMSDIASHVGTIPDCFKNCIACGEPAEYILCVTWDEEGRVEQPYVETAAEALAQELRAEFNTNFEMPFCATHLDGGIPS